MAQGLSVFAIAVLSIAGRIELWHVFSLAVVLVGQRGLPGPAVTFMYVAWIIATAVLIAGAIGARATVAIAGISGAVFLIAFVALVPGLRAPERDGSLVTDRMLGE